MALMRAASRLGLLLVAAVVVFANIVVDATYSLLDPRIRYS